MKTINSYITINGHTFEYNSKHNFYECRGIVCYDDEHDEVPEESLWNAAQILQNRLINDGYDAEAQHSEKGWVEVALN